MLSDIQDTFLTRCSYGEFAEDKACLRTLLERIQVGPGIGAEDNETLAKTDEEVDVDKHPEEPDQGAGQAN